ncbi:hypothetical protein VTN00DRAFT_7716 [Thermoascus crustaceus]|uniref:uncharacterized protein n=1 Tax=Thermoascus crustaceus TaxID=5088 RepID=UPI003741F9F6
MAPEGTERGDLIGFHTVVNCQAICGSSSNLSYLMLENIMVRPSLPAYLSLPAATMPGPRRRHIDVLQAPQTPESPTKRSRQFGDDGDEGSPSKKPKMEPSTGPRRAKSIETPTSRQRTSASPTPRVKRIPIPV